MERRGDKFQFSKRILTKNLLSIAFQIIRQITIPNLIDFIKKREDVGVQYGALLVINSMIKCCKGEKRQQFIKEINQKSCREAIYQHIISRGNIERDMGRELYTYQTYLLR